MRWVGVRSALCVLLVVGGACSDAGGSEDDIIGVAVDALPSPPPDDGALVRGAVGSGSALVVSTETTGGGVEESASLTSTRGDVMPIDFPADPEEDQSEQGLTPVATSEGFALGGYQCRTDPELVEPSCSSIVGVVLFFDGRGNQLARQTTPETDEASSLSMVPGPGDAVIVEGSADAWLVSRDGVEPVLDPPDGPLCGRPDGGLYVTETVPVDPDGPEGDALRYRILRSEADSEWRVVEDVAYGDSGVDTPFCTSSGLFVGDRFFDGEELHELDLPDRTRLTEQEVVGFTADDEVLTRAAPRGGSDGDSIDALPTWIASDRDGRVALRQTAGGLELVEQT